MTTAKAYSESVLEKPNLWLNELMPEFGTDDRHYAHRMLRACLHTLRDRLPVDESAQLAAQLPTLIRGEFYEGWDPSDTPQTYHHASAFLDRIAGEARLHGETEASLAASACWRLLGRHVSAGELEDVLRVLPEEIAATLTSDRGPVW